MTEPLSPAAQAVLEAYAEHNGGIEAVLLYERQAIAAALRAAAEHVVPEEDFCEGGFSDSLEHQSRASERRLARAEILAIAAELEGRE